MDIKHPVAGRSDFVAFFKVPTAFAKHAGFAACGILAVGLMIGGAGRLHAADNFPFDQELVLDAAPMSPAKRMPVLTVAADGRASVDLWCRSVPARVQVADSAIRIETAPLPEGLPQYMSAGQCSEVRMQADNDMLMALSQVTEWRRRGDGIELNGPMPMRFHRSSH
jgi:hypothetical protein